MTRRRALALAALALPGWAAAKPGNGVLPTRLVQQTLAAEEELLAAVRSGDPVQLEAILAEDFHMVVAQQPDRPVAGPDWIDAVRAQARAGEFVVQQLIAHDLGGTVVASFVLQAKPGKPARPPVFVVDTWQTTGPRWQLLVRHAASTQGAAASIPGYAATAGAPVKKY